MKVLLFLLVACLPAFGTSKSGKEALEIMEVAQRHYLAGEYVPMIKALEKAVGTSNDPLISAHAVAFANRFYSETLAEWDEFPKNTSASLFLQRESSNPDEVTHHFDLDMKAPSVDAIKEARVRGPNGRFSRIFDADMASETYQSGDKKNFIRRMKGETIKGALPAGLYTLIIKWSNGKTQEIPAFFAPDNSSSTLPTLVASNRRGEWLWTAPKTTVSYFVTYRALWVELLHENSGRALWSKQIEFAGTESAKGSIKIPVAPGRYNLSLIYMESPNSVNNSIKFGYSHTVNRTIEIR